MEDIRPPVVIILGRTASGKSSFGVEVARRLGSSIISVDSLQVYREFSVVSDKISSSETGGVRHYGIDILEPSEELNVATFLEYAVQIVNDELNAGRSPIVVGGTNMYIDKLLFTSRFDHESPITDSDPSVSMSDRIYTPEHLREVDPVMAERLHQNDKRRIARAIDYFYDTGRQLSQALRTQTRELRWPKSVVIVKTPEDDASIDDRIRERITSKMISSGGLERELHEIQNLVLGGKLRWNKGLLQAIGYREFQDYITQRIDTGVGDKALFDQAVEEMTRNTIRYAKKQLKWIKKLESYIEVINVEKFGEDVIDKIKSHGPLRVKSVPQWQSSIHN